MSNSKKLSIVSAIVILLILAGAGIVALKSNNKDTAQSNTPTQIPDSQSSLHSSMMSMSDGLKGKTGEEYDKAFIMLMSEHHAGAIAMAQLIDSEAKHPELRTLAGQIITAQTKEINDMRNWAQMWGYDYKEPSQASIDAMTASLKGKTGDDLDRQFIIDMVAHHLGAIDMANQSMQNAKHKEIKTLSDDIFMAQTEEIGKMQDWANLWGYDIGSSMPSMPGHSMPM